MSEDEVDLFLWAQRLCSAEYVFTRADWTSSSEVFKIVYAKQREWPKSCIRCFHCNKSQQCASYEPFFSNRNTQLGNLPQSLVLALNKIVGLQPEYYVQSS